MHTVTSFTAEGGRYVVEAVPDDVIREDVVVILESGKMRLMEEIGLYRYTYYELIAREAVYRPRARHYVQAIQDILGKDEAGVYHLIKEITRLPMDQIPRLVVHDCFSERDERLFRIYISRVLYLRCPSACFYYDFEALRPRGSESRPVTNEIKG